MAAIVLLAYGNSFDAGLTLDNKFIVGADPRIRVWSTENLRLILTENYWWPSTRGDLYRPLTTLSFLANYTVFGNGVAVFAYHAVNLLLHLANVALVFALIGRLGGNGGVAALTAALFGVHPVNVEAVTNIVGRADLLAALAVLSAVWCYVKSTSVTQRRRRWLVIAGTIAVLGAFAKENALMVVAMIVLYDFFWRWPRTLGMSLRGGVQWIRQCAWPGWIAFLPAVILLFAVRHALAAQLILPGKAYVDDILYGAPLVQRTLTALAVLTREVGLLVYPATLSCDYSYAAIPLYGAGAVDDLLAWLGAVLGAMGLVAIVRWRVRLPLAAWAVAAFFLLLLPTGNLLFPTGSVMAERFLYLPSIGFCALVALGCTRLAGTSSLATNVESMNMPVQPVAEEGPARVGLGRGRWRIALSGMIVGLLLVGFAWRTHRRNYDWHDDWSLWESAARAVPASFKVHKAYAQAIWERGKNEAALDQAIAETEKARRILEALPLEQRDESLYVQLGTYWRYKSELTLARGRPEEAAGYRARALAALGEAQTIDEAASARFVTAASRRLGPGAVIAAPGNAQIYLERAVCEQQAANWAEVRSAARLAERYAPSLPDGYALAGVAEYRIGDYNAAVMHFLAGLILAPTDPELAQNLARGYRQLGFAKPPVSIMDGRFVVAAGADRSGADLRAAFALLIRNHADAGLASVAKQLRDAARAQFGLTLMEAR